jgi:hypothetical protein
MRNDLQGLTNLLKGGGCLSSTLVNNHVLRFHDQSFKQFDQTLCITPFGGQKLRSQESKPPMEVIPKSKIKRPRPYL